MTSRSILKEFFSFDGFCLSLVVLEGEDDGNSTMTRIVIGTGNSGGQDMQFLPMSKSYTEVDGSQLVQGVGLGLVGIWERSQFYDAVLELAEKIRKRREKEEMEDKQMIFPF